MLALRALDVEEAIRRTSTETPVVAECGGPVNLVPVSIAGAVGPHSSLSILKRRCKDLNVSVNGTEAKRLNRLASAESKMKATAEAVRLETERHEQRMLTGQPAEVVGVRQPPD